MAALRSSVGFVSWVGPLHFWGATGAHHLEKNAAPDCPWRYAFTAYVSRTTSRTRDRPARICAFW